MAFEVIWSREAFKTYFSNIQYLKIQWSAKEIDRFIRQAEYVVSRIQEYPQSFSPSPKSKSIRRARINKYITLTGSKYKRKKSFCCHFGTLVKIQRSYDFE
jgi:hypothetical protein